MKLTQQEQLLKTFQSNPEEFFKRAWPNVILWDKLLEILAAVVTHRRLIVPSGHGVGKTWLLARIALWFLYCFPPAKVITTAPTWPQVENLLWSEIRKAHADSKLALGGRILQTELKIEEDWFAVGFSTRGRAAEREYGTPKFQGYHSENLMVLLDEGPGIEPEIWISIESLIVGQNNRVIAIGNPTSPTGKFYEACKNPLWHKIEISSFDHPNVKLDKILIPGAVTKEWIEERKQEWGEESPLWQAKVLGKFPTEGTDTLIPLAWAEACVGLDLPSSGVKRLGIDVARYGSDKSAFACIFGDVLQPIETAAKKDTNWTIGRAQVLNTENSFDFIGVDDTGVGGGVTDGLRDLGLEVDAMVAGSAAIENDKFENLTAEIYWNLRMALKNKELSLPNDKELINQLCSRKYSYTRKGLIRLESKDDMKKRGLKSPDKADALAIAYSAGRAKNLPEISIISVQDDE